MLTSTSRSGAARGGPLSEEELDFAGLKPNGHKPTGGWREASALAHRYDDGLGLSTADSAMLAALMNVPAGPA